MARLKSDGSDGNKVIDRIGELHDQYAYTADKGKTVTSVTLAVQPDRGRPNHISTRLIGMIGAARLIFATKANGLQMPERIKLARDVAQTLWVGPLDGWELRLSAAVVSRLSGPWFHGGMAGRAVGDLLLPAAQTGLDPRACGEAIPDRLVAVYITPRMRTARGYAEAVAGGRVYRVLPHGEVTIDPTELRAFALMMGADNDLEELARVMPDAMGERMASVLHAYACPTAEVMEVLG